jgi:ABC-type transport system involved in multi-copper enzyme maturation permease subunit
MAVLTEPVQPASEVPRRVNLTDGLLVFAFATLLTLAIAFEMPAAVAIVLLGLGLAILQVRVVRRGGWRLIGPHSYYDLIRMGRKGRTMVVRVAFLLALLAGIAYIHESHRSGAASSLLARQDGLQAGSFLREELARVNIECVHIWFLLQNATILLLTPAYMGGAIAEERDRGTLDMLLATHLYNREIVLGKLLARLVHLAMFLLAGLPVFTIMLVWGGIDIRLLLVNWLNSALLLLAAGCVCLMFSTMPVRPTTSILTSCAVVLPAGTCCTAGLQASLQEYLLGAGGGDGNLIVWAVLYTVAILGSLFIAIPAVRPSDMPFEHGASRSWDPEWTMPGAAGQVSDPRLAAAMAMSADLAMKPNWWRPALPPLTDDALSWKERYTGGRSLLHHLELWAMVVPIGGWLVCLWLIHVVDRVNDLAPRGAAHALHAVADEMSLVLRGLYAVCVLCFVIGVSFRAAASVVRERELHTLDVLFMIPGDRRAIIHAKWAAAITKGWPWLVVLAVNVVVGTATGAFHPCSALYLLAAPWPLILFACSVGVLVSVLARTAVQANLAMAGVLLSIAIGMAAMVPGLFVGFNALVADWWHAPIELVPWGVILTDLGEFGAAAAWVLALLAGAAIAWKLAVWRFERVGRS